MHKPDLHSGHFLFLHHRDFEHDSYVHAIEDMGPIQANQLQATFTELDKEAEDKKQKRPGIIEQDLDKELEVGDVPSEDRSRRVWAVLRNVEGTAGGLSELAIADVSAAERVMDIIRSRRIENYTYVVSARLLRGSRPSPEKLSDLYHHNGIRSTVNLCREMHQGDDSIIHAAGLSGKIRTFHIPIVDNGDPTMPQLIQFLEYLKDPDNVPVYVHCEQGVGRTGVMVACARMAFNGWNSDDAASEAKRFADGMPMQLGFIEKRFPSVLWGVGSEPWTSALVELGYPYHETPYTPPVPPKGRSDCWDSPADAATHAKEQAPVDTSPSYAEALRDDRQE